MKNILNYICLFFIISCNAGNNKKELNNNKTSLDQEIISKNQQQENNNSVNNKIACEKEEGNLESGFTTNCIISKKLNEAYIFFIKESKINEVQYLKTILPKSNMKYNIQNVDLSYNFENDKLQINLSFEGGESEIIFLENENKTRIIIKNYPD
ncbi:hypothetical protein [Empedobacter tilapiae]|uniref:Lipoprotein n=1 Tax=Empedobacter tilapiae TaxID=2491114 RepID=A0A4Z1AUJ5_9FLAO|nr:hypothetical protein [Empedobacter tilapiae]TGN22993.1 hypothetical protein E4J94_15780 [Empedobacter tilapiae]